MYAVYAFCREVDDIADGTASLDEKLRGLDAWRAEIDRVAAGRPETLGGVALLEAADRFELPASEMQAMVDGMETDARGGLRAPGWSELRLYCRRVAGSVGLMSIRVFGARDLAARRFAVSLGEAFQLTNVLRDVHEDAADNRLYLPREALAAAGADPDATISAVLGHAGLSDALADVAAAAESAYERAETILKTRGRAHMRPALVMAAVYRTYLNRMQRRGWARHAEPLRLSKSSKLWAAARGVAFARA